MLIEIEMQTSEQCITVEFESDIPLKKFAENILEAIEKTKGEKYESTIGSSSST